MRNQFQISALVLLFFCCGMATPLMAQRPDPRLATTYTPSPVSPYLNLGFNADGSSNYQTLVRPMIDEREGLLRQAATLQQMQQQMRGGRDGVEPEAPNATGRPQPGVRRMYYSHFYSGLRSGVSR
jgi:hypothetical protein